MESLKRKQLSENFGPDLDAFSPSSSPRTKRQRTHLDPDTNSSLDIPASTPGIPKTALDTGPAVEAIRKNGKPTGLVRFNSAGGLEHFLESTKTWTPAVYHNDIRAELIEEAARLGNYDHARMRGTGATDVTSYFPSQKSWGEDREQWPAVLFILDIKKAPNPADALPRNVPLWYRHGFLLLDQNNKPMRSFPNILPATCSSEMEDWLIVAIFHSDRRIQIGDIYARMPKAAVEEGHAVRHFQVNTLSMRMTRFRFQAALLPRETRSGSKTIVDGFKKLLGDQCFQENSTRRFGRCLTTEEVEMVREPNKGQFLQKSKNKKSTTKETTKRKRSETTDESLPQSQEGLNQVPQTGAKRIRRTIEGEKTVGTMIPTSNIGFLTPTLSTPGYPGSKVGTPGQFSGVLPARANDEGCSTFLQTNIPPYQASTYGVEGLFDVQAGTPRLFNGWASTKTQDDGNGAGFQAAIISNQISEHELVESNDVTNDFLAALTTGHATGQFRNLTPLVGTLEGETAQETEAIDETANYIFDEFDTQHGIGEYSHSTEPVETYDGNNFAENDVLFVEPSTRGAMIEGHRPGVNNTATNTYINDAGGMGNHAAEHGFNSTFPGLDYDFTFPEETSFNEPYHMEEHTTTSPFLTPHTAQFVPKMDDHVTYTADPTTNGSNSFLPPAMLGHDSSLLPKVPAESHTVLAAEQAMRQGQHQTMQSQPEFPLAELDIFDPNLHYVLFDPNFHFDLDYAAPPAIYEHDSFDPNTVGADAAPQAEQDTVLTPEIRNEDLANLGSSIPTVGDPTALAPLVAPADAEYPTTFFDEALDHSLFNPIDTNGDHSPAPDTPAGSEVSAEAEISTAIDDPELALFLANLDAASEDNMFAH